MCPKKWRAAKRRRLTAGPLQRVSSVRSKRSRARRVSPRPPWRDGTIDTCVSQVRTGPRGVRPDLTRTPPSRLFQVDSPALPVLTVVTICPYVISVCGMLIGLGRTCNCLPWVPILQLECKWAGFVSLPRPRPRIWISVKILCGPSQPHGKRAGRCEPRRAGRGREVWQRTFTETCVTLQSKHRARDPGKRRSRYRGWARRRACDGTLARKVPRRERGDDDRVTDVAIPGGKR